MSFSPEALLEELDALGATAARRLVVAFSGGLDSTVLLHALSGARLNAELLAVHVDHQLQPSSADWAGHCERFCKARDIAFRAIQVDIGSTKGRGVEAAAREARYAAFSELLTPGDWLVSAHHQDDQGETLLLNLMRGSGPQGLAGIPARRGIGQGRLVRPMLGFTRADLKTWARLNSLEWVEDPSNNETLFDRNYLRQAILPALDARWPESSARLRQSAALMSDTVKLTDALASIDLEAAGGRADRLDLTLLRDLAPERQNNLLRYAVRLLDLPSPPGKVLRAAGPELIDAREDANPLLQWSGAEMRRYRDWLFLSAPLPQVEVVAGRWTGQSHDLGDYGRLELVEDPAGGIPSDAPERGLAVTPREGGESIAIGDGHRSLKNLFQENAILPWMRDSVPLVYLDDELVAVAGVWSRPGDGGYRVEWRDGPAIR